MEITFSDKKLRKLCEQSAVAQKTLGAGCAKKLRSRLADIAAVGCVQNLVAGNPHPLKGDKVGQFALDLAGGTRLVFKPDHAPIPRKGDKSIDCSKVTKVCITFIGDYHD
jgi:toxin HigB-1